MGRHLTPEERAALGAMLTDAAPEVATLIATWVRANVPDFPTADAIGAVFMTAARMLRDAEATIGPPAPTRAEAATCDTCHQAIRWVPGVLSPPGGAPRPPRVCRRCTEAREQAAREGRPVTVYQRDRALVTFFPDGASVPGIRDTSGRYGAATEGDRADAQAADERAGAEGREMTTDAQIEKGGR